MDTSTKRAKAEAVRRRVAKLLATSGFRRTKTTFYVRVTPQVFEFVHLHLFSYSPSFRVHLGIRALNDAFSAAALNGPHSEGMSYNLAFDISEPSLNACAGEVVRFLADVGNPWFARWSNPSVLATDPLSPLDPAARVALLRSVSGAWDRRASELSHELLGVA